MNNAIKKFSRRFVKDEKGANLVEYIILVGLVALIAIGVFKFFGETVESKVDEQANTIKDNVNTGTGNHGSGKQP